MSREYGEDRRFFKTCVLFSLFCTIFVCLGMESPLFAARQPQMEEEVKWLGMRHLSGGLEFRYEKERNNEGGEGSQLLFDRNTFEERLNLKTEGYIYHPNLFEYNSESSIGIRQDIFGGAQDFGGIASEGGGGNSFLSEYNATASILQQKPISATVFANKYSIPVSGQFELVNVDSTSFGGLVRYRNSFLPMSLLVRYESTKEDSIDFIRDRTEQAAEYRATHKFRDLINSDFRYEYKDLTESTPTTQEVVTNTANLSSLLDRGKLHGVSNISLLTTNNQSNFVSTTNNNSFQISENFHYDHTKAFTSFAGYNFSRFTSGEFETMVNSGNLGVRHKLYESLQTELAADLSQTNASEFTENYFGPRFTAAYTKKVPGGVFSAGYNFLFRHTEREAPGGVISVFREHITLTDPLKHFLANTNVILSSVVVRDTSGVTLREGVDYALVQSGVLTEIQRLILVSGTEVVVDYQYSTPRNLNFDTLGNQFTLRYDFRRLFSVYYLYQSIEQIPVGEIVQTTETTSQLASTLRNLYGAETKYRWFTFATEYEDDNSELAPFTAWRVRGTFDIATTDRSHFYITASQSWTDYKKDLKNVDYFNCEAYFIYRLNTTIDLMMSGGNQREKGTDVDTDTWRFRGELRSYYRTLELKLTADYLMRSEMQTDRDELLIKLSLIRHFNVF